MNESEHKQNVLLVHNYYQIPGGEDTVVANEKKLLEDHGHKVVLYTRHNNELKSMGKLQKIVLPFTTVFNPRTYRDIKKIIGKKKIEIVHVHNTLNLISFAVYYAAVKMKVPVVQTIHNFRFLCPGATFYRDGHICEDCVDQGLKCAVKHSCYRGSKAQTLICVINTWIHRRTGILSKINYIVLTPFNREKIKQLKQIDKTKVYEKPNFSFALAKNNSNEVEGKRNYYLYIGRIEEIKGVEILINAFIQLKTHNLLIAGDGPLLEKMKSLVDEQGCNNVVFLGRIDHDEVMEKIKKAKAVILPSQIYEGFPMVIPEAFSLKTPMIVSNLGNCGSLIREDYDGLKFEYNSVDSLIQVIYKMEKADRTKLGENAYLEYKSKYDEVSNYERLLNIYNAVQSSFEEYL